MILISSLKKLNYCSNIDAELAGKLISNRGKMVWLTPIRSALQTPVPPDVFTILLNFLPPRGLDWIEIIYYRHDARKN